MPGPYQSPRPLEGEHDLDNFDCGSEAQTLWLKDFARTAHAAGQSRVYVTCRAGESAVAGYYALANGSVMPDSVPPRVLKGMGHYEVPVMLLTRLGVSTSEQRVGLGRSLVIDALKRTIQVAEISGVRAFLIHAESVEARRFYFKLAEFMPGPTDPLHLYLLMKDVRKTLAS